MPSLTGNDVPRQMKPYDALGLDVSHQGHMDHVMTECPFCGDGANSNQRKFSINVHTGLWRCFSCNAGNEEKESSVTKGGNALTFMRLLHKRSEEATTDYSELMESRGILLFSTLALWGAVRSTISQEWLLPGYNVKGEINQLYRWVKYQVVKNGKNVWTHKLMATPGLEMAGEKERHGIHGVFPLDDHYSDVYICEGPWDGMVLWEALGGIDYNPSVIAVPGCSTFFESWIPLLTGKRVHLLYDSDYPKVNKQTGAVLGSPGHEGMKRVARLLLSHTNGPSEVLYLDWGKK
jgi:hypothetical protein